jgi:hypothetical protein
MLEPVGHVVVVGDDDDTLHQAAVQDIIAEQLDHSLTAVAVESGERLVDDERLQRSGFAGGVLANSEGQGHHDPASRVSSQWTTRDFSTRLSMWV